MEDPRTGSREDEVLCAKCQCDPAKVEDCEECGGVGFVSPHHQYEPDVDRYIDQQKEEKS